MGTRDTSTEDTLRAGDIASADTAHPDASPSGPRDPMPTGNQRYHLGPQLGRGGMGDILLATDLQLARDVAIKRMRDLEHGSKTRFLREARVQGRLEHPAIVPVHEILFDDEGRPCFVMKRLSGTTLHDIIRAQGELSLESTASVKGSRSRLLRAFHDVCLAVEFAHTRGVIHRDLKPANIMLGDFGEVYVLDWGIARVEAEDDLVGSIEPRPSAGGGTEAGAVLGTVGYMPPEQLRGLPVDRRADVYALGCILFEILAGKPLHDGRSLGAVLEPYDARPSVHAPYRDVPPELEALVVAATAPDPADRPATARELGERVQRYLDGDRDVAQRRQLAREQLARARAALHDGDVTSLTASSFARKPPDAEHRRVAMQHAGRALALDPTIPDAAALVGRLMLEPPREMPPEIDRELDAIDDVNLRDQARVAFFAFALYLVFIPLMVWVGLTSVPYLVTVAGAAALNMSSTLALWRSKSRVSSPFLWLTAVANCIAIAILARMFSPLLVAPPLAAAVMLGLNMHPRFGKTSLLAAGLTLAVIGPWLLELAGIGGNHIGTIGTSLAITSPAGALDGHRFAIAHALFVGALLTAVGLLARQMTRTQRDARRAAHLQTWHLRHLVPAVPTAIPTPIPGTLRASRA
ncbi:MAG: protein kinase [Deltaproteobacteria bacterium]|nr:protein kinase [Deltaproteobacteria bacterium]